MGSLEKQAIELDAKRPKHDLKLVNLATVAPRNIEWLWYGRFPLGGVPSTGKTTIVQDMIARVSTGTNFPFTDAPVPAGDVLILTAEDDAADTIVPRLMAAGADLMRVTQIKSVAFWDENKDVVSDKQLMLSRDMEQLKAVLKDMPSVRLIVFDPLSAYLGADDSHRDADVRQVLGPLSDLASDYKVAVIGITHLNKTEGGQAMARFMGSTGIIAAAKQFLESCLAMGPRQQTEIEEDATSQGHSSATIRRAKNELGIQSHKDRFTGGWKWYTEEQHQSLTSIETANLNSLD